MKYGKYGKWNFKPKFALSKYDGLPEDAWIGFLREGIKPFSTRVNARPFTIEEQIKILTVGTCLTCHDENSKVMKQSLIDFENLLKQVTDSCLLPRWD